MGNNTLLGFLCVFFVVQQTVANYVSECLDYGRCTAVRVIAQEEHDIREALRIHESAQSVDLHGNLIPRFPVNGLQILNQLKTLNVSYNYLEEIQLPNDRNQKLQVVDITYNKLQTVTVPASVTKFYAVRNNLHTVNIDENNGLITLILPMNKINSLRGFGTLKQIIDLDLSCNQIKTVNLSILSGMSQLRHLNLANNHIHYVSGNGVINQLQNFDLSSNILTMVDETFNSFPSVQDLNLRNNKIVMWLHEDVNLPQLKNLDVRQNDWDCKNLEETYNKLNRSSKIDAEYQCEQTQKLENGICCTTSESPYVDRLIKYRWHEFDYPRFWSRFDCHYYVPNRCDGDDNRVYEVAISALFKAESLARSTVQDLQYSLQREKNDLNSFKRQHENFKAANERISNAQKELATYIDEVYKAIGLTVPGDEVAKLDAIFAHYDAVIGKIKADINYQHQLNEDKREKIEAINVEMDELESQKNYLTEKINRRNGTIVEYKRKIAELEQMTKAKLESTQ